MMKKSTYFIIALVCLIIIITILTVVFGNRIQYVIFGLLVLTILSLFWVFSIFDRPKKVDYRIISYIFIIFGLTSFLGSALLCFWGAMIPESIQLPLGHTEGVVKTKAGLIYIGLQTYNRIQVYDMDGKFIKSKYIDAGGGIFRIKLDKDGLVNIYTAREQKYYVLDRNDRIVAKGRYTGTLNDYFSDNQYKTFMGNEGTYYISLGYIYPRVILKDHSGVKHIIVSQPFYIWIFGSPLPAWIIGFLGILITVWDKKKRKKEKFKVSS